MPADYVPYGVEWETEMMRMRKKDLVDMVRRACTNGASPSASNNNRRDEIIRLLDCISAEDRIVVFDEYCTHCGDKNSSCQCWNDE